MQPSIKVLQRTSPTKANALNTLNILTTNTAKTRLYVPLIPAPPNRTSPTHLAPFPPATRLVPLHYLSLTATHRDTPRDHCATKEQIFMHYQSSHLS